MAVTGKNTLELIIAARDRTRGAFTKVGAQMKGLEKASSKITGAFKKAAKAGVLIGGAAVVGGIVASTKAFIDFEDAMANVRKTTGMTKDEISVLGDSIKELSLRIPLAQTELAGIAAVAGQLGISGKENILSFTEDVAKMTTAFDMSAEEVAIAMAKLSNIYDIPIEQTSNLGSAINVLGNTTAASESQLMAFSMSLGPTAEQLGFAATEALSLGASMIGIGMDASNAGTRLSRAFTMIGSNLEELSRFMGVTTEEFTESFERMPMETFMEILEKLSQVEGNLKANTIASELFNEIGAKAIKGLTGDLDGLKRNLENSAAGFVENTSLTEEFAAKTDTLKARFGLLKNSVVDVLIDIGESLAPMLTEIVGGVRKILPAVKETVFEIGEGFGEMFKTIESRLSPALEPLISKLDEAGKKLTDGLDFKMVMDDIGIFISVALKPLIVFFGYLIDKLGPVWDALNAVAKAFHFLADEMRTAEERLENLTEAQEEWKEVMRDVDAMTASLEDSFKAPVVILEDWVKAVKAFESGTGSYTKAVAAINKEIEKQKDLWAMATKEEKIGIDATTKVLKDQLDLLEERDKKATDHFKNFIKNTDDAIKKTKDFSIVIGDTTIKFEDQAAEVVKSADAYADLANKAETLLKLDWNVFGNLKADLPKINAGIGNMESGFVGLERVLDENIEKLENIEQSIMNIAGISAPFLEAGFLKGVEAIGNFANTLKDAGSAINTFANLQDISIDGCINFSLHVNDMVSALRILENQMEDLVPAFADMDSLITDIADAFLYSGGKVDTFISDFDNQMDSAYSTMKKAGVPFGDFKNLVDDAFDTGSFEYWYENLFWDTQKVDNLTDAIRWMDMAITSSNDSIGEFKTKAEAWEDIDFRYTFEQKVANPLQHWIRTNYGVTVSMEEMYELMSKPPEEQKIWLDKLMHSEEALTFQMDKQTNALKTQNEQLAKITTALEPYLNFMRTLNELAALSTISTDELNNGLNAIKDTITNLGGALADFDLRSVMESLFGDKGTAEGFMTTMKDYESKFGTLIAYIDRMAISMTTLVDAFESFSKISESILKDEDALRIVFQDIVDIMTNFNLVMSEGFGDEIVTGFEGILTSAQPLILYFRDNNMAVTEFNTTLITFKTTLSNVVSVMESLKKISEMTAPSMDELSAEFDAASRMVRDFNNALMEHVGAREGQWDMEKYFSSVFVSIKTFAKDWEILTSNMDKSFETFETASSTITGMINNVLSLSTAFTTLGNSTIASAKDMERAMQNINVFVIRFTDALRLNLDALVDALKDLDIEWSIHAKAMEDVMPSYKSATGDVTTLIGSLTSLGSAMESLAEMGTISSKKFDQGFGSLIENIKNFSVSLKTNVVPMITALESLREVWMKNEAVLVPLMQDFVIITKNFASMATNANIMIDAFERLAENSGSLEEGFKTLIKFIKDVVENTKEFYTPETANEIAAFVEDIEKVIDSFADLDSKIESAVREIENEVSDGVREIKKTILGLSNLNEDMFTSGQNLMKSFINGINDMQDELETAVEAAAKTIDAHLGVESPTERGPLRNVDEWPKNLVQSFSKGINAEMETLNNAFRGMVAPATLVDGGGHGGNHTSVVFHVTQNIKDQPTADYATNELKKMLNRHEVL
jgi:TP901 family phage tail tape measure protein